MKKLLVSLPIVLTLFTGCRFNIISAPDETIDVARIQHQVEDPENSPISDEVEKILNQKLEVIKHLAKDQLIISRAAEANNLNSALSQEKIQSLDEDWQKESNGIEKLVMELLTNDVALLFVRLEEEFPGFTEIFLTDKNGLIIGSTKKTLDYYQRDEIWWAQCMSNEKGIAFYSGFQYDLSAKSEGVTFYAPVRDKDEKAIGCIKAFLDITAIYQEIITNE